MVRSVCTCALRTDGKDYSVKSILNDRFLNCPLRKKQRCENLRATPGPAQTAQATSGSAISWLLLTPAVSARQSSRKVRIAAVWYLPRRHTN